jgi:transposase IS4-like protein
MPDAEGSNRSSLADAIGIGTLTRLVPRELVDEVVASAGRREIRRNKLSARVMMYFFMAMALFHGDAYEEVMRKLAKGLDYMGTWRREWNVPSPGGLCRPRLPSDSLPSRCSSGTPPAVSRADSSGGQASVRMLAPPGRAGASGGSRAHGHAAGRPASERCRAAGRSRSAACR